jgi:pilus assembly protein Flp/PilA
MVPENREVQRMLRLWTYMVTLRESLRDDERGATAVEYGVMVALIAAVIVGVVTTLGSEVKAAFQKVVDAIP